MMGLVTVMPAVSVTSMQRGCEGCTESGRRSRDPGEETIERGGACRYYGGARRQGVSPPRSAVKARPLILSRCLTTEAAVRTTIWA